MLKSWKLVKKNVYVLTTDYHSQRVKTCMAFVPMTCFLLHTHRPVVYGATSAAKGSG